MKIRLINWLAVAAAVLCAAALAIVIADRTLWTTAAIFVAGAAVLAYLSKEDR